MSETQLPKGFLAAGVNCGVRQARPDLGIIISQDPSVAVVVVTQNTCKAAPIRYCQEILPCSDLRAVITNSGQANAATGKQGDTDNATVVAQLAVALGCQPHQIAIASTGVVGERLALDKITSAIPNLVDQASKDVKEFSQAILTTDTVIKVCSEEIVLSQGKVRLTGVCKGSGMIHPNMATMLAYFMTDAKVAPAIAQTILTETMDESLNMVSIDGEMSTNDCAFLLANGASGIEIKSDQDLAKFKQSFLCVAQTLAELLARDGEGATKVIVVTVAGVSDRTLARKLARSLTTSPLIKTAIHGCSPNWGRILVRLGAEGVAAEILDQCSLSIQGQEIFSQGQETKVELRSLEKSLAEDTIHIHVDLRNGSESACAWGCDLSAEYVKINAEYLS
ncbi:MAG: bifunctional glutamate N-acetyltransferase/amino-acid acetyltransferase ArgJ [Gammaproteobacteria bacterium]